MSYDRLPPLTALRAFEAAARHLSFRRAAEELFVTPGAISQQIRLLEDHIGVTVFKRSGRQVLLTDAGQAALPLLREGFDRLADAARILRQPGRKGRVTLSVAPSFAAKWLVPRLDNFHQSHGDVEVWISAAMEIVDLAAADLDLAIRYGPGQYAGLESRLLLNETVVAVCNPGLIQPKNPIHNVGDLAHYTLLHDGSPETDPSCPDWAMWLKARGADHVNPHRGPRFNQTSLVIEAAANGAGIALAKKAIAQADLAAGRLIALFAEEAQPVTFAYHLVWGKNRPFSAAARRFVAWLEAEAQLASGSDAGR